MASFLAIAGLALLAPSAAPAGTPVRDRQVFESDSVRAAVVRIAAPGANGAGDSARPIAERLCDTLPDPRGPAEWFRVEVAGKAGAPAIRFPVEGAALRDGLREACRGGEEGRTSRLAEGLRDLAGRLRVRMRESPPEASQ